MGPVKQANYQLSFRGDSSGAEKDGFVLQQSLFDINYEMINLLSFIPNMF